MSNRPGPGAAHPRAAQTQRAPHKALLLFLALASVCAALTGCQAVSRVSEALKATPQAETAGPNLALLTLPAYQDAEGGDETAAESAQGFARVDLWLDATPNLGGINVTGSNMYPHAGKKYREGGFHYRYGTQTGWYQSLLGDFLIAAGDARVRALRVGAETFPDGALATYGLAGQDDASAASVWRDLHTCSLNADAALFASMTAEDMAGSFYAPGAAAWVNRIPALDAQGLENPTLAGAMGLALSAQAEAIAAGDARYLLSGGRDGQTCALYEALAHLDPSHLSIVTADPASLADVTGADASGAPVAWYERLLRDQGVFDKGLSVGVLDFQLDYLGQLSTVCSATLSEPLIWGRVLLHEKTQLYAGLGVMPRRLLTLVIGPRAMVADFMARLGDAIASDTALKGLRGPQDGELTYAAGGETVVQQPFGFEWNATVIARPGMGYYTQHTEGAALAGGADTQTAVAGSGLPLVRLPAAAVGNAAARTLSVRFPLEQSAEGATLDVSALSDAKVQAVDTLLLSDVLANSRENLAAVGADAQAVAYRDKLYVFRPGQATGAFSLTGVTLEGDALVCRVAVDGAALKPGYYRLRITADATGKQVAWESVPWIDGPQSVSASVSDRDAFAWETFTAAITQYDRNAKGLIRMFQHAWGGATEELYHGLRVPDFPPIYRSIRLKELADQFRAAAASDVSPLIRYAFEVFVPNP